MEMKGPNGETRMVPKPETLEYGIGSFVYTSRRPFHPHRLWDLVSKPFCVIQNAEEEEEEEEDEEGDDAEGEEDVEMDEEAQKLATLAEMEEEKKAMDLPGRAKFKRESPIWKGVLRSKGFIWMATRPNIHGEWSQAGIMYTLTGGGPWMCCVPEEEWPANGDKEVIEQIKLDFMGEWGDRKCCLSVQVQQFTSGRQEIVFIGQDIDKELLSKALDEATLNDKEWASWEKTMKSRKTEEKKIERLYNLFDGELSYFPSERLELM